MTISKQMNHAVRNASGITKKVLEKKKKIEVDLSQRRTASEEIRKLEERRRTVLQKAKEEAEEALRQSLDEGQKQKQQEDIELEEAIKLSLFEHQIPSDTENNTYTQLSLDDKNEEMEECPELSYKIIGAITHHGFTPNSAKMVEARLGKKVTKNRR
uniref:Uncharacterized protein n=1 Tax=Timema genevievae TaxID=629358 RepID=A0A7R9PQR8_TIMGE|nr:unnamed protein product [Timema genevievae]